MNSFYPKDQGFISTISDAFVTAQFINSVHARCSKLIYEVFKRQKTTYVEL